MTLNEQIAIIDGLPLEEQEALTLVCNNEDQEVPEILLVCLLRRKLIMKKRSSRGYTVISHWVHYAWQQWQTAREKD
jgi:hypothetical protein